MGKAIFIVGQIWEARNKLLLQRFMTDFDYIRLRTDRHLQGHMEYETVIDGKGVMGVSISFHSVGLVGWLPPTETHLEVEFGSRLEPQLSRLGDLGFLGHVRLADMRHIFLLHIGQSS